MADELDPLVARILLSGDDEFLSSLKQVGEKAKEAFEKLSAGVEKNMAPAEALTRSLGLIEAAVAGVTAATVLFIEQQTELAQKTILLAEAFGTTAGRLQGLEAVFAASGVKVEQFERFANRLTITIAREWPQIAESIKTYATENDAATLRISSAILRIRDAQNAVADNAATRSAEIAKDYESMRGAALSLTEAENHLREVLGVPVSDAEKLSLKIAEARLAIDKARTAQADAARKAAKDERDDAEQAEKDQNRVKEAVLARAEAEQKAAKLALTNIASIRDSLDSVAKGNKDVRAEVDLTQVSVKHLTDAIIAQAAEHSKAATPTGFETLIQLSRTLSKASEDQITQEQKLAIVNRLAGTSMQALGVSAAEILNVLEHDTAELEKFNDQAKALDTKEAKKAIEDFRGALAGLNLTISLLSRQFAIAVSPAFTAFLRAIQKSIEDNNGIIHVFLDGLQEVGRIIGRVADEAEKLVETFAKWIGLKDAGPIWTGIFIAIGIVIAATATALLAWPLIIGAIVLVIGYIADNWDKVKKGAAEAWKAITDNAIVKFLETVIEKLKEAYQWFSKIFGAGSAKTNADARAPAAGAEGPTAPVPQFAGGGPVSGPGTGTSDSIIARISNGEFINTAASVQKYGAAFFHSLNNMTFPGFAAGGLVASPMRLGGADGGIAPATSTLNLSIDGRSFNGLKGPKSTVDDLSSFAISRQASAAGSNPSWMK